MELSLVHSADPEGPMSRRGHGQGGLILLLRASISSWDGPLGSLC